MESTSMLNVWIWRNSILWHTSIYDIHDFGVTGLRLLQQVSIWLDNIKYLRLEKIIPQKPWFSTFVAPKFGA